MEELTNQILTPGNFPKFYRTVIGLRFPIKVADVLDLRAVLNEAMDQYEEPANSPTYREFVDALESAITSFGVENRRHSDRLVKLLTLLRDIHYNHSISSRDKEVSLRTRLDSARESHTHSKRYGIIALAIGFGSALVWTVLPVAGWTIKLLTLATGYMAWGYFHSLPVLVREQKDTNQELNDLLRDRITNVDWKMLIHKLSLLMGFKKVSGIEVFNIESDEDTIELNTLH
ncbi:MAG: hypothetical protein ACC641_05275 [Acidiferrobacterales bacterium]